MKLISTSVEECRKVRCFHDGLGGVAQGVICQHGLAGFLNSIKSTLLEEVCLQPTAKCMIGVLKDFNINTLS